MDYYKKANSLALKTLHFIKTQKLSDGIFYFNIEMIILLSLSAFAGFLFGIIFMCLFRSNKNTQKHELKNEKAAKSSNAKNSNKEEKKVPENKTEEVKNVKSKKEEKPLKIPPLYEVNKQKKQKTPKADISKKEATPENEKVDEPVKNPEDSEWTVASKGKNKPK